MVGDFGKTGCLFQNFSGQLFIVTSDEIFDFFTCNADDMVMVVFCVFVFISCRIVLKINLIDDARFFDGLQ